MSRDASGNQRDSAVCISPGKMFTWKAMDRKTGQLAAKTWKKKLWFHKIWGEG